MEWYTIVGIFFTAVASAFSAWTIYKASIEKTEREDERLQLKDKIDGDTALRDDLMELIKEANARNAELARTNKEQQDFIDQQIIKRRMEASENDRLTRIIKDLREENDKLRTRLSALEQKMTELQIHVESTR